MPTKTMFAPHLGREVRVNGCKISHLDVRHPLSMRLIMHEKLVAPSRTNFSGYLGQAPRDAGIETMLSQMFLNNRLGDCVIAARARRVGLLTGNARGVPWVYTEDALVREYGRIGGYVAGNPSTDNGCDPTVSADDGVKNGYADGSKDAGWISVNAASWDDVMLANYVTNGACDLSMALPDSWISEAMPRRDGDVWDVAGAPDPNNGHNVAVVDHDAEKGLLVDTWGLLVWVTPRAVATYGAQENSGMLIAHVNHDAIATSTRRAPAGFDWATMLTYFTRDLGGQVVPGSELEDAPESGPTLAHAQAWAAEGCSHGPALMTRSKAAACARTGLAARWPR